MAVPLEMRVATFNVRHCEGLDGVVDVGRVAGVMRDTRADLIALQELDRGLPRSGEVDQPAALAEATGMHVAFHATLHRTRGDYGIGIATAEPLDELEFDTLPQIADEEPRGMLLARYRGVEVVVTHLTRKPAERPFQLEAVARAAALRGPRVLVLGDLNVEPKALGPLADAWLSRCEGLRTLPARRPRRQIDHILAGPSVRIERCTTLATDASDHRPLIADVVFE